MDFPIAGLIDEHACYDFLLEAIHPGDLACPRWGGRHLSVHRRHRDPVLDHHCKDCRQVFNAFTGTAFHKTRRRPSGLVLILRGIAQWTPTARLAR